MYATIIYVFNNVEAIGSTISDIINMKWKQNVS